MADVTLDPQSANHKELFSQGVRAYVLQDFETAVSALSKASEIIAAEHGNDTHDSLGDVYLYYGKSLLELSRKESGPLGDGVLQNVDEESEPEEGEASDTEANEQPETDAKEKESVEVNGETTEEKEGGEDKGETSEEKMEAEETDKDEASGEPSDEIEADKKEGEASEELNDLQVAWEVLELAKRIFTNRGQEGTKNLAESLIVLGEISLESGNYSSAIEDISEGLKLQKTVYGDDSRTVAETYYKLGGALATNGQIDEAIDNFNKTHEYLKKKVSSLVKDEQNKELNAEEIEELNNLIPEVEEKILDMKNLKVEVAKKLTEEAASSANGTAGASSSKPATDISHLVKRKRKEDEEQEEKPAKKPSPS